MIDYSNHFLSPEEKADIAELLEQMGGVMSLEAKRQLMDKIWQDCGCSNKRFDAKKYSRFYNHPIWLLHGILQEEHDVAMTHRNAICRYISGLNPAEFATMVVVLALSQDSWQLTSLQAKSTYMSHTPRDTAQSFALDMKISHM